MTVLLCVAYYLLGSAVGAVIFVGIAWHIWLRDAEFHDYAAGDLSQLDVWDGLRVDADWERRLWGEM